MEGHDNEQAFAWETVSIGADDRSLTLGHLHPSPSWSSSGTWWSFCRTMVKETAEAVCVGVILCERTPGTPGAMPADDSSRTVPVILERPLAGRVIVDGCARLVKPEPRGAIAAKPQAWHRIHEAGERTLVVYWRGGPSFPLDHLSTRWGDGKLFVTVWVYGGGGRLAGAYYATILQIDHPLGDRQIVDGAIALGDPG